MKKCFVISPIGEPGSDTRQQADAVFDYIIKPALEEMEVEAVRGDHFPEPGLITNQVIEAILTYDFCIADLSGRNPNVFYELAIAQAACRPAILLRLSGEQIPFGRTDSFRCKRLSLNCIRSKTSKYEVASSAKKFCYIMGVSLKVWGSYDGKRVLASLAQRIPVRVLIMNPTNPGLDAMINTQLPAERLDAIKMDIQGMEEYFRNITKSNATFQVRTIEKGMPYFQLILTDKTALVLQYMFCRGTQDSPLQRIPRQSELYSAFFQEFEDLWNMNEVNQSSEIISDTESSLREKPY